MKKTLCYGDEDLVLDKPLKIMSAPIGSEYDVFLYDIREPEYYQDLFYILKTASENDIINIHINSHGGSADALIQLRTYLRETDATVIAHAEGMVASAGSMLFLSCNAWNVYPNISFMCHNYSSGTSGKGSEMASQIDFEKVWSKELMHDCYAGFLTDKEIDEMLAGKDFWMGSKEVSERLTKLVTYREKEFKKQMKGGKK